MGEIPGYIPEEYRNPPVEAQEAAVEEEETEKEYDPREPLRRDFSAERIHRNEKGEAVIDDPDLHTLMQFYRDSVKEGSLLDVGAGATHQNYMTALEDKLSRITALDLSPRNIQLLQELQEGAAGRSSHAPDFIEPQDIETLKLMAEAVAQDPRYGKGRTAEQILQGIDQKTRREDGSPDLVVGDMYDLRALGDRKFDNVMLAFSLFVSKDEKDLQRLFAGIKEHMNLDGRLIVSDFGDPDEGDIRFQDEDLDTFREDKPILDKYHTNFRLDKQTLHKALQEAGLTNAIITEKPVQAEGAEQKGDLAYMLATAKTEQVKNTK